MNSFDNASKFLDEIEIPAGLHEYPFNFQLPLGIPSSLEHDTGYIRYTAKAIIDRSWKFDHESKVAFTVVAPYDLNHHPTAAVPIDEDDEDSFCCFCFSRGAIMYNISAPVSGYVPGQIIPVTVSLENHSRVDVTSISLKLKKKLIFRATIPHHDEKKDSITVKEERVTGPFDSKQSVLVELKVPPEPPSALEFCNIIGLYYEFVLKIHVSGMHCNIEKTFPIEIGTVPLNCIIPSTAPPIMYESSKPGVGMQPNPSNSGYYPIPSGVPGANSDPSSPNGFDVALPNPSAPLGFVNAPPVAPPPFNPTYQPPPPSYGECMHGTKSIINNDETEHVYGANQPFAPRYPVYDFSMPTMPPSSSGN